MTSGIRRTPTVLWRRTIDGAVLLLPGGEPVKLNGSAAAVWVLLDRCRSAEELVTALVDGAGAPDDMVVADIEPLLHDLVAAGLATPVPG